MGHRTQTTDTMARGARAVRDATRGHARVVAAGATAVGVAAAAVLVRRRRRDRLVFPDPGETAVETIRSIHDAAKATVIVAVRAAETPDSALIVATVREAVRDAGRAGVDVTAVALGAVEGAVEVAKLLDATPIDVGVLAAEAARAEVAFIGPVAAERLDAQLPTPLLTQSPA